MPLFCFLTTIFVCTCICSAANVKFYMNSCIQEKLVLNNYHNYTGKLISDPPPSMVANTQSSFEYSYALHAIDGSILDGNLNYYPSNEPASKFFHYFININSTGGLFLDVVDEKSGGPTIDSTFCTDIELNNNNLPSIIGTYFWIENANSFSNCYKDTPIITGCKYMFNCSFPNPCNVTMT